MSAILLLSGVLAGVTTVLFGFGGGFVVVPLLYALQVGVHGADSAIGQAAMHIAIATSTGVMIFGAGMATLRHRRAGTLAWTAVRPLMLYIAVGAVLGAAAASRLNGDWIRWVFVAYLGLTLIDSVVRPGFLRDGAGALQPMARSTTAAAGVLIGAIASFLGVGGSVMTVPLMRRRGASMTAATAMANPLSLPMAVTGTLAYVLLSRQHVELGSGFAGYVDVRAGLALVAGSWLGIRLATPWIGKMPDGLHAKAYLALLTLVLVVMVVV